MRREKRGGGKLTSNPDNPRTTSSTLSLMSCNRIIKVSLEEEEKE